jgi:hypothetical protein
MDNAAEHRAKARELRELASTTHDEKMRAELLVMADQYDSLAKALEAEKRETEKS